MRRILDLPLLVILMGLSSALMLLPSVHAFVLRDYDVARPFLYAGVILLTLSGMIGIATSNYIPRDAARSHLVALMGAYIILPVMLAIPFQTAVGNTTFLNAWFEMISSFTTTGATVYDDPRRLSLSLHLWRALVGWMGGFFVLITAVAILAPMNLGGVEVISGLAPGRGMVSGSPITRIAEPSERISRYAVLLFPAYGGLTLLLWVGLLLAGETGIVALCHAMSTLSTSAISPIGGLPGASGGFMAEFLIFCFLVFSLTRRAMPGVTMLSRATPIWADPEIRMAAFVVGGVTTVLFLRHWLGAIENAEGQDLPSFFRVLWGIGFTTLSFLTTTGFTSVDWGPSKIWSGLDSPGLILLGLALIGGGVATTAGGVKLLRVYALFRHGERELERLIYPNSIGGQGSVARRLRREGAYVAWIFFMLFAISIAITCAALALTGLGFEQSVVLTIAALTTTGPLAGHAAETPISYADLSAAAKMILAAAMVLGRIETLAILALLAPDSWRK